MSILARAQITIVVINDGPTGPTGKRMLTGMVHYQLSKASAPAKPSATSFNFATRVFSGLTSNWAIDSPVYASGNANKYWYCTYTVEESASGSGTGTPIFGTVKQAIGFSGLVTFTGDQSVSDGTKTLSFGPSGSTKIDGGNIETGTVSADRIDVDSLVVKQAVIGKIQDVAGPLATTAKNEAINAAASDATSKANAAKSAAETYALAKANLAETNAKAHADGIVDAEEARAIADATAKANAAKAAAEATAAALDDAIQVGGRNFAQLTNSKEWGIYSGGTISFGEYKGITTIKSTDNGSGYISIQQGPNARKMLLRAGEQYIISLLVRGTLPLTYNYIMNTGVANTHIGNFTYEQPLNEETFVKAYLKITGAANFDISTGSYFMTRPTVINAGDWIEITQLKIEKGNKATDWTPAPEDVQAEIDDVSTGLTNLGAEINTAFSNLSITNIEANNLDLLRKSLAKEVADVRAIAVSMSVSVVDLDSKISALNTEVNKYAGKADSVYPITVTVANRTAIDTAFSNLEASIVALYEAIDKKRVNDIEIGGRNLLLNSKYHDFSLPAFSGSTAVITGQNEYNTGTNFRLRVNIPTTVKDEEQFVFSFAFSRPYSSRTIYVSTPSKTYTFQSEVVSSGIYKRYSFVFTKSAEDSYVEIYTSYATASWTLNSKEYQIELGNKATDWTPAPEDVPAEINAAKDAIAQEAGYTDFADMESKADLTVNGLLNSNIINTDQIFADKLLAFSAFIENLLVKKLETDTDTNGWAVRIENNGDGFIPSIKLCKRVGGVITETAITISAIGGIPQMLMNCTGSNCNSISYTENGITFNLPSGTFSITPEGIEAKTTAGDVILSFMFNIMSGFSTIKIGALSSEYNSSNPTMVWKDSKGYLKIGNTGNYTAADVGALPTNTIQYFTQAQWAALTQAQKNAVPLALVQE